MHSPFDVIVVCADPGFQGLICHLLGGRKLRVLPITNVADALGPIRAVPPRLLILEWTLRDLAVIDFLIKISESNSWGQMAVYFVCNHELTASEAFQMQTLGTDMSFLKQNLLADPGLETFLNGVDELFQLKPQEEAS